MSTYTASRKDGERLLETISKGWNSISIMFGSICRPSDTLNTVHTDMSLLWQKSSFPMLFLFLSQESRPLSNLGGRYVVSLSPFSGTFLLVLVSNGGSKQVLYTMVLICQYIEKATP